MVVPPGEPGEASGDGPEEGESGGPSGGEGRRGGSESGRAEAAAAAGDKPETRSVCSSESGSGSHPGGAGPICKICFQGPEQVRRREEKRARRASGFPPPAPPRSAPAGPTDSSPQTRPPPAPLPGAAGGGERAGLGGGNRSAPGTGLGSRPPGGGAAGVGCLLPGEAGGKGHGRASAAQRGGCDRRPGKSSRKSGRFACALGHLLAVTIAGSPEDRGLEAMRISQVSVRLSNESVSLPVMVRRLPSVLSGITGHSVGNGSVTSIL